MLPCLTLSIIRYGSRISGAIQGKEKRPLQHLGVVAIENGSLGRYWLRSLTRERYKSYNSLGYRLNSTITILPKGWLRHWITHEGWYVIKQRKLAVKNVCIFIYIWKERSRKRFWEEIFFRSFKNYQWRGVRFKYLVLKELFNYYWFCIWIKQHEKA